MYNHKSIGGASVLSAFGINEHFACIHEFHSIVDCPLSLTVSTVLVCRWLHYHVGHLKNVSPIIIGYEKAQHQGAFIFVFIFSHGVLFIIVCCYLLGGYEMSGSGVTCA